MNIVGLSKSLLSCAAKACGISPRRSTVLHSRAGPHSDRLAQAHIDESSYWCASPRLGWPCEVQLPRKSWEVATSYMIEALRIYDHYIFRVASEERRLQGEPLELKHPPGPNKPAWFDRDWLDPIRARNREVFSSSL